MKLETITEGLRQLLLENHYNPATIHFYEREWDKIHSFLIVEYGDSEYNMERGLKYLENKYNFVSRYNDKSLTQQRVQLLRVVHMLEDYALHQVLTRRYYASKNPISLNDYYTSVKETYADCLERSELSESTKGHYKRTADIFLDYLSQRHVRTISEINIDICNSYLKTLAGYSFKTVEQNVCGLRHLLRHLYTDSKLREDYAERIHMPAISKNAKIPSAWSQDELKAMIAVIDRNNPIGKRDYAMILLACILGLRIGDIKNLTFKNFDWERKELSIIQHNPPCPDPSSVSSKR